MQIWLGAQEVLWLQIAMSWKGHGKSHMGLTMSLYLAPKICHWHHQRQDIGLDASLIWASMSILMSTQWDLWQTYSVQKAQGQHKPWLWFRPTRYRPDLKAGSSPSRRWSQNLRSGDWHIFQASVPGRPSEGELSLREFFIDWGKKKKKKTWKNKCCNLF